MPDHSADSLRRRPAALLAYARAVDAIDKSEYNYRLGRLNEERPDTRWLVGDLPRPMFLLAMKDAPVTAADRAYVRVLLGLSGARSDVDGPRLLLAKRVKTADTAGELQALCSSQERASHADRRAVVRMLRVAEREGRLDAAEYDTTLRVAETAKTRAELAEVHADLPDRTDPHRWAGHYRIGDGDREWALTSLAGGLADERLTEREYEDRVLGVSEARRYADLVPVLDGLPIVPDGAGADLLVSDADRRAALGQLEDAVADGRVTVAEHGSLQARIQQADRLGDIAPVLADLDRRASLAEREDAVRLLDAARDDGRLDPAEHLERTRLARAATLDKELIDLLSGLWPSAWQSSWRLASAYRVSHKQRAEAAGLLKQALDEGRLDLGEYDERVSAAYDAKTLADIDALLADLVEVDPPPKRGSVDLRRYRRLWQVVRAVMLVVWAGAVVSLVVFSFDLGSHGVALIPVILGLFTSGAVYIWMVVRR
jgi:hypothetical protein